LTQGLMVCTQLSLVPWIWLMSRKSMENGYAYWVMLTADMFFHSVLSAMYEMMSEGALTLQLKAEDT
jgi:hypothetical protein